jgi:cobalt-zinc-cadmium efflux system outer membrane protein
MFARGRDIQAAGLARAARLRAELAATRVRIGVQVQSAFEAYSRRLAALDALEADAVPGIDDNEVLATRSFEAGQIGLPELLLLRREILDTRSQYLETLLEVALARVDLESSAGLLR